MKAIINVLNEVDCVITGLTDEHVNTLYEHYGIYVDGYKFMPSFQLKKWDGKVRFFSKTGKTYTKILDEILCVLIEYGYEIELKDNRSYVKPINDSIDKSVFGNGKSELRDYQVNFVNTLLSEGSGFGICGTGGGKTKMCAALAITYVKHELKVLVIVPSTDLVIQTAEEFEEELSNFDVSIGRYSGEYKDINHNIVVATWQSLQNVPHYMGMFQAVIVDEAHGAKASVIKSLMTEHGAHIRYRFGVTGTFPKPLEEQLTLQCVIGKKHIEISSKWLIENGFLTPVEIIPVITQDKVEEFPEYSNEKEYLSGYEPRLNEIADFINSIDGNTLILVQHIKQGEILSKMLNNAIFIKGAVKSNDRKSFYAQYEDVDDLKIIATYGCAKQGISINRIFNVFLLDLGKSFITTIQSIGRGLRLAKGKSIMRVFDVTSKLKYSKKHLKDRLKYYKEAEYPVLETIKLKIK